MLRDLHVVVGVDFAIANLLAHVFEQGLDMGIQVPLVDACERREGQGLEAFCYAQIVPSANVFLVRVVRPRVVGNTDDRLLDVDEAGLLQQLARAVLVGNGARHSVCGVGEPAIPLDKHAVLRERVVIAARLHVDFDVLDPACAGLEVSAEIRGGQAKQGAAAHT